MSPDEPAPNAADELLPAIEVIEQQPLAERAGAYAALLDGLAHRLDSTPPAG